MIEYPNKLNIIFDKLDKNAIIPIIIGGYVRDYLLKIDSKDIDIELYGVTSLDIVENILKEFGDVNSVGKSFGVCKLSINDLDIDFSLPRQDSKTSSGHSGFTITTDESLDFKIATSRRDFTINAIGYDVNSQKILDPFNGVVDLKDKLLRAVDIKKFAQDPLRVLRAVGFSSRLNFKIEKTLFLKCKEMIQAGVLNELPKERIYLEIEKILLKSKNPSKGFLLLQQIGAFTYFNELEQLSDSELKYILLSIDTFKLESLANQKTSIYIMFALLSSNFSQSTIEKFLTKFSSSKNLLAMVKIFVKNKNSFKLETFNDYDIYKLATDVNIEVFTSYLSAYYIESKNKEIAKLIDRAKVLKVFNEKVKPLLQGRDLIEFNLKPSKEFSEILNDAYEAQMHSEFNTHQGAIFWLAKRVKRS